MSFRVPNLHSAYNHFLRKIKLKTPKFRFPISFPIFDFQFLKYNASIVWFNF